MKVQGERNKPVSSGTVESMTLGQTVFHGTAAETLLIPSLEVEMERAGMVLEQEQPVPTQGRGNPGGIYCEPGSTGWKLSLFQDRD